MPISTTPTASEINVELGRAATDPFSIDGAEERGLAQVPSGPISFNDFIGKSAYAPNFVSNLGNARLNVPVSVSRNVSKWLYSCYFEAANFNSGAPFFMQRVGSVIYCLQLFTTSAPFQGFTSFNGGLTVGVDRSNSPNNQWSTGFFYHLLASFDSTRPDAEKIQVYLNDQPITMGSLSVVPTTYAEPVYFFFDPTGTAPINLTRVSEVFLNYGETLDLSVEANRRLFYNPLGDFVDLGANGQNPLGFSPDFYFGRDMTAEDWNNGVNLGTDTNGLTVTNTFVDYVPPEYIVDTEFTAGSTTGFVGYSRASGRNFGTIVDDTYRTADVISQIATNTGSGNRMELGLFQAPIPRFDFFEVVLEGVTDPNWNNGVAVLRVDLAEYDPDFSSTTYWWWVSGAPPLISGHTYRLRITGKADPDVYVGVMTAGFYSPAPTRGYIRDVLTGSRAPDVATDPGGLVIADIRYDLQGAYLNHLGLSFIGQFIPQSDLVEFSIEGITDPSWNGGKTTLLGADADIYLPQYGTTRTIWYYAGQSDFVTNHKYLITVKTV